MTQLIILRSQDNLEYDMCLCPPVGMDLIEAARFVDKLVVEIRKHEDDADAQHPFEELINRLSEAGFTWPIWTACEEAW